MKFLKLSVSLLVATSALVPFSSPAQADPFSNSTGLFGKSPVNTLIASPVTSPTGTPSNNSPGSEVAPLGTHDSWLKPQIFTKDPKALCDTEEVALGNDTTSSTDKTGRNTSGSSTFNQDSTNKDSGGGGGSVLFGLVSANGSGHAQSANNNNGSSKNQLSTTQERVRSTSKARAGRKVSCGAVLEWSARRDMNYEDNLTQRYGIKLNRNAQQVDSLLTLPRR